MVYCTNCGAVNDDEAEYCSKCGAALHISFERDYGSSDGCFGRQDWGDTCFGVRRGGAIIGIIIGILIIIAGISALIGEWIWNWIGPFFVIVIGFLIIFAALSKRWR